MKKESGLSIVEVILAIALSSFVLMIMANIMLKMNTYFQRSSARNVLDTDARNCMTTMTRYLQQGKASSTAISTPTNAPPYSRIDFVLASNTSTAYAFFYSQGTVQMQVTQGGAQTAPQTLAKNVTSLNFTGDALDPGYVNVTLRLDAPIGSGKTEGLLLANQIVHMVTTL